MRTTACDSVCALIDREAIGWTEAERLRVEQHLNECAECSENLNVSRFVRQTLRDASSELSEGARARAIKNALQASTEKRPSLRVSPSFPRYAVGLGLAAAAAVLIWFVRVPGNEPVPLAKQSASAPRETRLAEAPRPTPPAVAPVVVESTERAQHKFAHATVTFAPNTRTRFDEETRTLTLERGAIDVDVNPTPGLSFQVETENFRVEVLGTQFSLTTESVTVKHGRVRVLAPTGLVLASELGAGQTYTAESATPAAKKAASTSSPKIPARVPVKSAKELLTEARSALYHDDKAKTRSLIAEAERARPGRVERAEAGTLRAELAMLERDHTTAVGLYREVATRYAELPAGENAAFAAAQLALKVAPNQAPALLQAYLTRYPDGRFASQVRERLRRLEAR